MWGPREQPGGEIHQANSDHGFPHLVHLLRPGGPWRHGGAGAGKRKGGQRRGQESGAKCDGSRFWQFGPRGCGEFFDNHLDLSRGYAERFGDEHEDDDEEIDVDREHADDDEEIDVDHLCRRSRQHQRGRVRVGNRY